MLVTPSNNENWNNLSTDLDCGIGAKSHNCMSQVPAMKILEARAHGNYSFYPVVDNVLVFPDYAARARRGKLARLVSTAVIFYYHIAYTGWNISLHWLG